VKSCPLADAFGVRRSGGRCGCAEHCLRLFKCRVDAITCSEFGVSEALEAGVTMRSYGTGHVGGEDCSRVRSRLDVWHVRGPDCRLHRGLPWRPPSTSGGIARANVKPGQLPGRFARWALAGDWRVWLAVCWTVVVAGVLIIWEVYVALSPDDGWVSNGALEWISAFGAVVVWMLGLFGVVLISIAAFLVRRTRERVARAQQGRVDSPDWR